MENLIIKATKYTPEISLDANGTITMIGKSYPENTFEFYEPVMNWMKDYFESAASQTTINMEITYFNSSSSKLFFDFFDLVEENNDDHEIIVNWIFDEENESAEEAGEDFKEDFEDLTINLVTKD
ncbi:MAG: DUF1987 domain-containing protein [Campylobacterota bacterium]|nr:DUF1987 domain-containing protein [Campylobacterota bacterium]